MGVLNQYCQAKSRIGEGSAVAMWTRWECDHSSCSDAGAARADGDVKTIKGARKSPDEISGVNAAFAISFVLSSRYARHQASQTKEQGAQRSTDGSEITHNMMSMIYLSLQRRPIQGCS